MLIKKDGDVFIVDRLKVRIFRVSLPRTPSNPTNPFLVPPFFMIFVFHASFSSPQEIFKVRGFQVAPAELEGHLLDHSAVADAGVIGLPDDFSGDVPMAFIVLSVDAAQRVAADPKEAERIKAEVIKVRSAIVCKTMWLSICVSDWFVLCSACSRCKSAVQTFSWRR